MFPAFPGTTSSCICSSVVSVFNLVFFLFKDSFLSGFCCGLTCSTFMNVWCLLEATFLFSIRHFLLFFSFLRAKFPFLKKTHKSMSQGNFPILMKTYRKTLACIYEMIWCILHFVFLSWWHWQGGANFGSLCNLIGHCSPFFLPFGDTCSKVLFLSFLPFGVLLWKKETLTISVSYH